MSTAHTIPDQIKPQYHKISTKYQLDILAGSLLMIEVYGGCFRNFVQKMSALKMIPGGDLFQS